MSVDGFVRCFLFCDFYNIKTLIESDTSEQGEFAGGV